MLLIQFFTHFKRKKKITASYRRWGRALNALYRSHQLRKTKFLIFVQFFLVCQMHFRQFSLYEKTPSQSRGRVPGLDQTGQASYFIVMPTSAWGPQPRHHVCPLPLQWRPLGPSGCTHQRATPPAQGMRMSWGEAKGQSQPTSTKLGTQEYLLLAEKCVRQQGSSLPSLSQGWQDQLLLAEQVKSFLLGEISQQASRTAWAQP